MQSSQVLTPKKIVALISADAEWRAIRALLPHMDYQASPYGEWFKVALPDDLPLLEIDRTGATEPGSRDGGLPQQNTYNIVFSHGGWGKIAAAGSTQYAIDRWQPDLLINLGTCGGFEGEVERGTIILVEKTIVYDIIEQMVDIDSHIAHYTTELDLTWLREPYPLPVKRSLLVSGDRDLLVEDIPFLKERFNAIAGDWESGAIAFTAYRNDTRVLILRGVTDLVGARGGEAYGNISLFEEAAKGILSRLINSLPSWLERIAWC